VWELVYIFKDKRKTNNNQPMQQWCNIGKLVFWVVIIFTQTLFVVNKETMYFSWCNYVFSVLRKLLGNNLLLGLGIPETMCFLLFSKLNISHFDFAGVDACHFLSLI